MFTCTVVALCIDGDSGDMEYVHSPVGLFPAPLGPSTRFSIVEDVCSKFKFLGKLMAKAIMDSRMVSSVWLTLQKLTLGLMGGGGLAGRGTPPVTSIHSLSISHACLSFHVPELEVTLELCLSD